MNLGEEMDEPIRTKEYNNWNEKYAKGNQQQIRWISNLEYKVM